MQLYASVCRVSKPLQDGSRASTPGSKMSQATSGMREVGPDGAFYLRVGTQWVKVGIPLLSLAVLAALSTACTCVQQPHGNASCLRFPTQPNLQWGQRHAKHRKAWRQTRLHYSATCITAAQKFFQTRTRVSQRKIAMRQSCSAN